MTLQGMIGVRVDDVEAVLAGRRMNVEWLERLQAKTTQVVAMYL